MFLFSISTVTRWSTKPCRENAWRLTGKGKHFVPFFEPIMNGGDCQGLRPTSKHAAWVNNSEPCSALCGRVGTPKLEEITAGVQFTPIKSNQKLSSIHQRFRRILFLHLQQLAPGLPLLPVAKLPCRCPRSPRTSSPWMPNSCLGTQCWICGEKKTDKIWVNYNWPIWTKVILVECPHFQPSFTSEGWLKSL